MYGRVVTVIFAIGISACGRTGGLVDYSRTALHIAGDDEALVISVASELGNETSLDGAVFRIDGEVVHRADGAPPPHLQLPIRTSIMPPRAIAPGPHELSVTLALEAKRTPAAQARDKAVLEHAAFVEISPGRRRCIEIVIRDTGPDKSLTYRAKVEFTERDCGITEISAITPVVATSDPITKTKPQPQQKPRRNKRGSRVWPPPPRPADAGAATEGALPAVVQAWANALKFVDTSKRLEKSSSRTLRELAIWLIQHPDVRVRIRAPGTNGDPLMALRRSRALRSMLEGYGVPIDRMVADSLPSVEQYVEFWRIRAK